MTKGKKPNVPVCLSKEIAEAVEQTHAETGFTRSEIMRRCIEMALPQVRASMIAYRKATLQCPTP